MPAIRPDATLDEATADIACLSDAVFSEIWDNDEDAVYDKYLPSKED